MKKAKDQAALQRRQLLAAVGTTGALVAGGALVATHSTQGEPAAAAGGPDKAAGYQLTAHVQRYYQTAKV